MKNLLIVVGLMVLGTVIFQMMVGDNPGSLKSSAESVMRQQIAHYGAAGGSL